MGNTIKGGSILARGFSALILTNCPPKGKLSVFQKSAWLIRGWPPGATHGRTLKPVHGFDTDISSVFALCVLRHVAILAAFSPLVLQRFAVRASHGPQPRFGREERGRCVSGKLLRE